MKKVGSIVASQIVEEYRRKEKYKKIKEEKQLEEFKKNNCTNCKNKTTDKCHITKNIDNKWICVFKEV